MRIYNGTNSVLDLPLTNIQRLSIPPKAVSGDFMPTNEFLGLLVSTFDYSEIAIIVSGPYEISMCAGVSGSVGFVVQTLEEAIERFAEKAEVAPEKEVVVEMNEPAVTDEECDVTEEACEESVECPCVSFSQDEKTEAEVVEEEVAEEEVVEEVQPGVKKSTKKTKKNK